MGYADVVGLKDEIDEFHDHLNEQNADIQFTREVEEDGKLPFLDCLVSRDENTLRRTVYRKLTHTDRLLDESSYNPTSHKATTIKTLTRRAQLVCNTPDSLSDENKYLRRVFDKTTTKTTLLDETITDLNDHPNDHQLNSYGYSEYTVHQGHVRNHRADPTTLQHLRSPQT